MFQQKMIETNSSDSCQQCTVPVSRADKLILPRRIFTSRRALSHHASGWQPEPPEWQFLDSLSKSKDRIKEMHVKFHRRQNGVCRPRISGGKTLVSHETTEFDLGLKLMRPLVVYDLETTAIHSEARIIELAIMKIFPDNRAEEFRYLLNPGISIPAASTEFHGYTDADVWERGYFSEIASKVQDIFRGSDILGYNNKNYDNRVLQNEGNRLDISVQFIDKHAAVVDAMKIFKWFEKKG